MWPTLTGVDAQGSARAKPERPPQIALFGEGEQRLRLGAGTGTKCGAPRGPSVPHGPLGCQAGRWGEGAPRKSFVEPGSRRRAGTWPWCAACRAHRRPFPARAVGQAPRRPPHRRRPSVGTEDASACACVCAPAGPQLLRRLRRAASCAAPLLSALLGGKGDSSLDLYRGSWLLCDLTSH